MATKEPTTIWQALIQVQTELKPVSKDSKNPFLKNKYASLDAIIEAAKPILNKYGLGFIQKVSNCGIETVIFHESGEQISSGCFKINSEVSKGLSNAQTEGVSITYSKRYQLGALLGISTDEDTDGRDADDANTQPQSDNTQAKSDSIQVKITEWLSEENFKKLIEYLKHPDKEQVAIGMKLYLKYTDPPFGMKKDFRKQIDELIKNK